MSNAIESGMDVFTSLDEDALTHIVGGKWTTSGARLNDRGPNKFAPKRGAHVRGHVSGGHGSTRIGGTNNFSTRRPST